MLREHLQTLFIQTIKVYSFELFIKLDLVPLPLSIIGRGMFLNRELLLILIVTRFLIISCQLSLLLEIGFPACPAIGRILSPSPVIILEYNSRRGGIEVLSPAGDCGSS